MQSRVLRAEGQVWHSALYHLAANRRLLANPYPLYPPFAHGSYRAREPSARVGGDAYSDSRRGSAPRFSARQYPHSGTVRRMNLLALSTIAAHHG